MGHLLLGVYNRLWRLWRSGRGWNEEGGRGGLGLRWKR